MTRLEQENNASLKRIATALEKLVNLLENKSEIIFEGEPGSLFKIKEEDIKKSKDFVSNSDTMLEISKDYSQLDGIVNRLTKPKNTIEYRVKKSTSNCLNITKDDCFTKGEAVKDARYDQHPDYKELVTKLYNNDMLKAEKILTFIGASPNGRRFQEIQKFITELNYPNTVYHPKNHRGIYCTNFYGNARSYYRGNKPGLLNQFCTKKEDGRWYLTSPITPPFYPGQ